MPLWKLILLLFPEPELLPPECFLSRICHLRPCPSCPVCRACSCLASFAFFALILTSGLLETPSCLDVEALQTLLQDASEACTMNSAVSARRSSGVL